MPFLRMIKGRHLVFFQLLFKALLISEHVEFFISIVQFSAFHNTFLGEPLKSSLKTTVVYKL